MPLFQKGDVAITLGDSITQLSVAASATKISHQAASIFHWANLETGYFKHANWYDSSASTGFRGCNFGVAGDSASMLLARLPSILRSAVDMDARVAIVLIGTNTGTTDSKAASKISRIKTIISELNARNIHVMLGTILPRAVTGTAFSSTLSRALMDEIILANEQIRQLESPTVTIWDAWDDMLDKQYPVGHQYYGTIRPEMTYDGVHLTPVGAFTAAQSLKNKLRPFMSYTNDLDSPWFNTSPSQTANRLTAGAFSGTAGTVGTGCTGVVPTSWSASVTSPTNVSVVTSLTSNANTGGNTWRIAATSTGAGVGTGYERLSLIPLGTAVNEPAMTAGKYVRLMFKVRVQNPDGVLGALTVVNRNSTSGVYGYAMEAPAADQLNRPFPTGTYQGWLISEPVKYNASDVFVPYIQVDTLIARSGTVVVDLEAAILLEEDDATIRYPFVQSTNFLQFAPLENSFFGVVSMQTMGSTSYTPDNTPNGVAGSLTVSNGWMKATIRTTDPDTASGIRSEVVLTPDSIGTEYLYQWTMRINKADWPDNTGKIVIGQMHPEDSIIGAVNFAFWAVGGRIYFEVPQNLASPSFAVNRFEVGDIQFDTDYDMSVAVKWTTDSTGYMRAFVNGVQIYNKNDVRTAYSADAPYFKLGVYDGPHLEDFNEKTAYFKDLKRYSGTDSYTAMLGEPPKPQKDRLGVI